MTILRFCFGPLGVADEEAGVGALMVGMAAALGRGEGAAEGRGDGAADGRGEGAADPLAEADAGPSFVLILSLVVVVGSGMGEWMAGGVEMPVGILTGAGAGRAGAGRDGAATTGAGEGAGGGTGVFTIGAGVAGFDGGATTGAGDGFGVGARDSGLAAAGVGARDAFADSGKDVGELTTGGENIPDCCLDLGGPGSADGGGGDPAGFSFSDIFSFGADTGGAGA